MTTQTPITLWVKRLGEDRRERFHPVQVSAASYAEDLDTTQASGGVWTQKRTYKIRIPLGAIPDIDGLRAGDLITPGLTSANDALTEEEVRATGRTITVTDWADNTRRGSDNVKHWRITGR